MDAIFYNDIEMCVIKKIGDISVRVCYPERVCKQRDPISPYPFLLCALIFGIIIIIIIIITKLKGILIDREESKLSQYAGDTSLLLDGSPTSKDDILQNL